MISSSELVPMAGREKSKEEAIVGRIMQELQEEFEDTQSYFKLIPEQYRDWVKKYLVEANFEFFQDRFKDEGEFKEAMSKNWLAKFRSFGALARQRGFVSSLEAKGRLSEERLNKMYMAFLTKSASYFGVEPGAFDESGPGATAIYSRLPYRNGMQEQTAVLSNIIFYEKPEVGKPLLFSAFPGKTSPVVQAYYKAEEKFGEADSAEGLEEEVERSFAEINNQTLH